MSTSIQPPAPIRSLLPNLSLSKQPFYTFNREERNHAALLYHLLLLPGNTERLLQLVGVAEQPKVNEFGLYFEYAYLRDFWEHLGHSFSKGPNEWDALNEHKRRFILDHLKPRNRKALESLSVMEFNGLFTGSHRASRDTIQNPGKWSLQLVDKALISGADANVDLMALACFKWSFNIKPDLVIHLSNERAICIEIKLDSGEGSYPSMDADTAVFNQAYGQGNWKHVTQTALQRYLFEILLGVKTDFFFLTPKESEAKGEGVRAISWPQVLGALKPDANPFVLSSISSLLDYVGRKGA